MEKREVKLGEIVAYRAWCPTHFVVFPTSAPLRSTYMTHTYWWRGSIIKGDPEGFGSGGTPLGVHAYKTEELLRQKFLTDHGPRAVLILGSVLLWGRVTEHTLGYRAEYARIKSIDSIHNLQGWRGRGLLRRVRKYYRLQEE